PGPAVPRAVLHSAAGPDLAASAGRGVTVGAVARPAFRGTAPATAAAPGAQARGDAAAAPRPGPGPGGGGRRARGAKVEPEPLRGQHPRPAARADPAAGHRQ